MPERTEYERIALGRDFVSRSLFWSASVTEPEAVAPNLVRLRARLDPVIEKVRSRIAGKAEAHPDELAIYEDSAQYLVFERHYPDFAAPKPDWRFYDRFAADWDHFFFRDSRRFESALHAPHMFACFRQVQHAFRHTFFSIIGNSMPAGNSPGPRVSVVPVEPTQKLDSPHLASCHGRGHIKHQGAA